MRSRRACSATTDYCRSSQAAGRSSMSRRLFGYLIVAGLTARALVAQEDLPRMRRRADSLLREAAAAQAAVVAYRKAHPLQYQYADSALIAAGRVKVYF